MKAKVIHRFTDKYTGEHYSKGDVLDISEERYTEIMSVGRLLHRIAQNDVPASGFDDVNTLSNNPEETPTNDSETLRDGFDVMSVRELKEYANVAHKLTFKTGTKKAEIIETLRRMEHGK